MKTVLKWIGNVLLFAIVAIAILSVASFIKSKKNSNYIPGLGSYKFMAVLSGSMSPTFNVYDMIVDKEVNTDNLKKGDVITFWSENNLVTHRIVDVENKNGKTAYKTRGDANNIEDEQLVVPSKVAGVYLFRMPYMGLILSKLRGIIGLGIVWVLLIYVVISEFFGSKKKQNKLSSENIEVPEYEKKASEEESRKRQEENNILPHDGSIS